MRKFPLIILTLVVLAVGGRFIYGAMNHPDDKTLIKQALADAIQASKEGQAGSVVDKLTENFRVNDVRTGTSKIAELVKNNHPVVDVKETDPIVSGDSAQITSDVSLHVSVLGQSFDRNLNDVQLLFKKETGTDWLIFPATRWRLAAARIPSDQMAGFEGQ